MLTLNKEGERHYHGKPYCMLGINYTGCICYIKLG